MFVPSEYQKQIFDFVECGDGSAIVKAVAGSGKTSTIVRSLERIADNKRVLFLAFNKAIADELRSRCPSHVQCRTLNSLGHGAICSASEDKVRLDSSKLRRIAYSDMIKAEYSRDELKIATSPAVKLVNVAKAVGLAPSGYPGLVPDDKAAWEQMLDVYDIQIESEDDGMREVTIALARDILATSVEMRTEIDFADQLYYPVIYDLDVPKFDYVFVDEAQDISSIQRVLISKALKPDGRLVAIGDPHQAIYAWRGADSSSMDNIATMFNTISLPLSVSYRCPKAIVAEAKKYVPHIESHENAPEGTITKLGVYNHTMFQEGDMVMCRNTAPLIRLAYHLISNKVTARVAGRDIGSGLISLIKALNPKSIGILCEKLDRWRDREIQKLIDKNDESAIPRIEEKHEIVMCFVECSGADSIEGLICSIEVMFADSRAGVLLSTVHRAKGLEADRCFILDSWLMPSKYATKDWQIEQENNLIYVAVTRAKKELIYVETPRSNFSS